MFRQIIVRLIPVAIACACDIPLLPSVHAEENADTTQVFFEYLPAEGEGGRNWQAAGSRRIVVHNPDTIDSAVEFGTPDFVYTFPADFHLYDGDRNLLLDLTETTWVRVSVVHLTDDGVEMVRSIYWLVTEPGDATGLRQSLAGLTAATGPDGDVTVLGDFSLGSAADGTQYLNHGGNPVRFSAGVFSK